MHYCVTHPLATSFTSLVFFITIAVEIICTFFKGEVQLFFLIWQVAAKVAVEPSFGQSIQFSIRYFLAICFQQKSYDVNTKVE
jgi:hypothetical protein